MEDAHAIAGIIPRNGKNIKFADLHKAIKDTYNVSAPFSHFLPRGAAQLLDRDLAHDTFDLSDVSVHNMIEHDASWCRTSPPPFLPVPNETDGVYVQARTCSRTRTRPRSPSP